MSNLFYNCTSLTSLSLKNFNTEKVMNMDGMFYSCSSLEKLDLSSFDTSSCQSFQSTFYECNKLTILVNPNKCLNMILELPPYVKYENATNYN
jgi:surface protein